MDIVYICREGDNEELRYSIRSAVKNLPHDNLWVVGGKPDWYTGKHIPVEQNRSYYVNARNNLRAICASRDISESFVLMNDDFFIMNPTQGIPYFHCGYLKDRIERRLTNDRANMYTYYLNQTYSDLFQKRIYKPVSYELHVPFVFEKEKLFDVLGYKGLWRSLYGNIYNVGGEQMEDVKLFKSENPYANHSFDMETATFVSTEDEAFPLYKEWFQKKFPEPSLFESP
jgi:hypothetical protein